MRIDLKCPYDQKDIAKGLGALWDPSKKVWYILNQDDLTPFLKWIPGAKNWGCPKKKKNVKTKRPKLTGPKSVDSICSCDVLPWDHCKHTMQKEQETA